MLNREIVMASSDKVTSKFLTHMKRKGRIVKIARRIYTTNLNDTPENIIRRNLFYILGELYPNAVLSHRSAFECRPTNDGHIYLTRKIAKIHVISTPMAASSAASFFVSSAVRHCPST